MPKTSLDINPFWPDIRLYNELGSTNAEMKSLLARGKAGHGTVVSANFQSQGRGQLGASWHGEPGKNLYMSLLLEPKIPVEEQYALNKVISISICSTLADYAIEARIKWPNDILVFGKKVAGILIENSLTGNMLSRSIIGIGINVNQSVYADLPHAAGLIAFTHQTLQVTELQDTLLARINETLVLPRKQMDLLYEQLFWTRNEVTTFEQAGRSIVGKVKGVDSAGNLVVDQDGEELRFMNKEIRWTGW